ncbi:MAG: hypothetical protein HGA47_14060, partial [Zoogloea sp.]|nr:hypothetical protein [Zoogloea sp.]
MALPKIGRIATGLLVVLAGRATKLARFFVDLPKEYECTVRFGVRSDTGDLTGELTETGETTTRQAVEQVIPRFVGRALRNELLEIYGDGSQTR